MQLTEISVLPQDVEKAASEHKCIHSCYSRIEKSIFKGEFEEAKLTTIDLLNSIRELERLHEKKVRRDRFEEVVKLMRAKGISVEMVVRNS
ncbi:hypothetical protein JNUCC23_01845 [Peribacillus sp. JNUCC 23]